MLSIFEGGTEPARSAMLVADWHAASPLLRTSIGNWSEASSDSRTFLLLLTSGFLPTKAAYFARRKFKFLYRMLWLSSLTDSC